MFRLFAPPIFASSLFLFQQSPLQVEIHVDADEAVGEMKPIWAFFGYDEPNYTYMEDGRKLLTQIAAASPVPVYVRAHNLLNTHEGPPGLKWGSSNAYTEDESGEPTYDWTIVDRIFDTYVERGMRPLVEIAGMPRALSSKPEPYRHSFSLDPLNRSIEGGWAYPPKDYDKWAELIYQLVKHCIDRYGLGEAESWLWEVWNEPNIHFWRGTKQEYFKLYDYTVDAVRRALPTAQVGGPHLAGGMNASADGFLRDFFEHVLRGRNHATAATGSPIDFLAFHAKGRPEIVDDHVQMGINRQLARIDHYFEMIASYPKLRTKPIIIGESDPEGCAACSARVFPHNAYRNGTVYSSYTAASFARKYELAEKHNVNLLGALTWAFEFENQPWFDGFRELATNGIEKPVLNVFRMFGLMSGERVATKSSHGVALEDILKNGVREKPDVAALASRDDRQLSVMVWHYHDDNVPGPEAAVDLLVSRLPASETRALLTHYRVDHEFGNSYTAWKRMGSPQDPSPVQYRMLERVARLTLLESPRWTRLDSGDIRLNFKLPRQGVSLIQLSW